MNLNEIQLDEAFRKCLRRLTDEEYHGLETDVLALGRFLQMFTWWRDPEDGLPKLVDGHHRFMIWQANSRQIKTPELFELPHTLVPDRLSVIRWIHNHHKHRRNLERHERDMQIHEAFAPGSQGRGKPREEGAPSLHDIAETFEVSPGTANRAVMYGNAIETLRDCDEELVHKIENGTLKVTRDQVIKAAKDPKTARKKLETPKPKKADKPKHAPAHILDEDLTDEEKMKQLQQPFRDALKTLRQFKREFKSINGKAGVWLGQEDFKEVDRRCKNVEAAVTLREPAAFCAKCKGEGGKCKTCSGKGVLTRTMARSVDMETVPF